MILSAKKAACGRLLFCDRKNLQIPLDTQYYVLYSIVERR